MPAGIFLALLLLSPPLLRLCRSFHWRFLFRYVDRGQDFLDYTLSLKYLEVLVNMHLRADLVFKE